MFPFVVCLLSKFLGGGGGGVRLMDEVGGNNERRRGGGWGIINESPLKQLERGEMQKLFIGEEVLRPSPPLSPIKISILRLVHTMQFLEPIITQIHRGY